MSDVIEAASVRVSTLADGTLRLVLDIEPRHAQDAFKLFGSPGTAVALAALKSAESLSKSDKQDKPVQSERTGPLCLWAVLRCKEPEFQRWVSEIERVAPGSEEQARCFICDRCGVASRKDLDGNADATARLRSHVVRPYAAWLQKQGVTA